MIHLVWTLQTLIRQKPGALCNSFTITMTACQTPDISRDSVINNIKKQKLLIIHQFVESDLKQRI